MAARVGLSRRPVYGGWARGKLEGALDAPTVRSPPRRTKLDPYTPLIEERLVTYPQLTAVRLFDEGRAARTGRSGRDSPASRKMLGGIARRNGILSPFEPAVVGRRPARRGPAIAGASRA